MKTFGSVEEILDFAIAREEEAVTFYRGLSREAKSEAARQMFADFAAEEKGHKAKLQAIQGGKLQLAAAKAQPDLQIGDYLVEVEAKPDLSYQEVLIVAMKKEKAAFRLYTDLAARVEGEFRQTFLSLAQEEAKHKLRFELEYDEQILTEN